MNRADVHDSAAAAGLCPGLAYAGLCPVFSVGQNVHVSMPPVGAFVPGYFDYRDAAAYFPLPDFGPSQVAKRFHQAFCHFVACLGLMLKRERDHSWAVHGIYAF